MSLPAAAWDGLTCICSARPRWITRDSGLSTGSWPSPPRGSALELEGRTTPPVAAQSVRYATCPGLTDLRSCFRAVAGDELDDRFHVAGLRKQVQQMEAVDPVGGGELAPGAGQGRPTAGDGGEGAGPAPRPRPPRPPPPVHPPPNRRAHPPTPLPP